MGLVVYTETTTPTVKDVPILVKPNIKPTDIPILVKPNRLPTDIPILVKPNIKHTKIDYHEEMIKGVKYFEGFRSKPYFCSGKVKTIGYGCTDPAITRKGYISEKGADKLLRKTLHKIRVRVLKSVDVDLTEWQLAALTSFAFNAGMGSLETLIGQKDRLNDGNYGSVVIVMPLYRNAGGKIRKGLVLRRAWEVELYEGKIITERS
jgi:GH24 family phage-related lysozyme (muramidase)